MKEKINIKKGDVQETLLLPLCGRALETRKDNPRLIDKKAVEIMDKLDYDFSEIIENMNPMSQLGWVARSLHMDRKIRDFIQMHPKGTIVNIGCGMDTTFTRIDNGEIRFYELDLPDVIELRKSFFEDGERYQSIASSFLEPDWYDKIVVEDGLLCVAGGVLYYSEEARIKQFFKSMADRFECCEFFFDSLTPLGIRIANKKVLKAGGMNDDLDKWGLKPVKSLETWDSRFKVLDAFPMYRGMKNGTPLKMKMGMIFVDTLGIASMIHLGIS